MKCRLHQAHAEEMFFSSAVHYGFHQLAAGPFVLCGGIDRDWANAGNCRTLVHAIATNNLSLLFGHHAKESRMFEHERHNFTGNIRGGEVWWKVVVPVQRSERFVADATASVDITRLRATDGHC